MKHLICSIVFSIFCLAAWLIFSYQVKKAKMRLISWIFVSFSTTGCIFIWISNTISFYRGTSVFVLGIFYTGFLIAVFPWCILSFWYRNFLKEKLHFWGIKDRFTGSRSERITDYFTYVFLFLVYLALLYGAWYIFSKLP